MIDTLEAKTDETQFQRKSGPQDLRRYQISLRDSQRSEILAFGSICAQDDRSAKHEAIALRSDAQAVIGYSLRSKIPGEEPIQTSARVRENNQTTAKMIEPWLGNSDWLRASMEIFITRATILDRVAANDEESSATLFSRARTPLSIDRLDELIKQVIATDPAVRRARAKGLNIAWNINHGYCPGVHAHAGLDVAAGDDAIAISSASARAILCMSLRANNYRRRSWATFHGPRHNLAEPTSATLAASLRATVTAADPTAWKPASAAINYLRRTGLAGLAEKIRKQAITAA